MKTVGSEAELQSMFTRFLRSVEGRRWLAHANVMAGMGGGCRSVACGRSLVGLAEGATGGKGAGIGSGGSSGAFELKLARGTAAGGLPRLRLGQVEDHQVEALRRAWYGGRSGGVVHKISDMAFGVKPFDCFVMDGGVPAWVVAGYVSGVSGAGALVGTWAFSIGVFGRLLEAGRTVGIEEAKRHGVAVPL